MYIRFNRRRWHKLRNKKQKINDNLVKLQDCQIGVKDGEFSIANRLGVTNGEETNLTAQHKILREDHKDIK